VKHTVHPSLRPALVVPATRLNLRLRTRQLCMDPRGSSELSVSTLLVLGGVACVGIVLPSLVNSAHTMGDVFKSQVSVLAGQSSPGGNGSPQGNGWSISVGQNGVSASGPQGSFSAGPRGASASGSNRPTPAQSVPPIVRGGARIVD